MKMKKGNALKLTQPDRIQALLRSKQFLKDLKETIYPFPHKPHQKGFSPNKIRAFEKKYGKDILAIDMLKEGNKEKIIYAAEEEDRAVELIPIEDAKFMKAGLSGSGSHVYGYNKHPFIRDKRFITLKIDLTKDKKDIRRQFKKCIDAFDGAVNKASMRSTPPRRISNIWTVYDMHRNGLSFSAIARRMGNHEHVPSWRKAVERAYKKAMGMIEMVEKDVKRTN